MPAGHPAAVRFRVFAVDVARIADSEDRTRRRFLPGMGLVVFNCRRSNVKGCVVCHEPDEKQTDNTAGAACKDSMARGTKMAAPVCCSALFGFGLSTVVGS